MHHLEVLVEPGSVYDSVYEGLGNQVGNDIAFLGRRDTAKKSKDESLRLAYNNAKLTKTDSLSTVHTIKSPKKAIEKSVYIPIYIKCSDSLIN